MEKLIFPAHIGKLEYIMPAMQVYVEANDWVKTADYIDREFAILKANGIESVMKKDKTDYTKDAELPRYFGFVERQIPGDVKSDCRITALGMRFYNAVKENKQQDINEAIMTAFETVTFGRNNAGCPRSNTRLEAPNILLIASLMLDGVSRIEYAGILYEMLYNHVPIVNALVKIKLCRKRNEHIKNTVRTDNKVVPFLVNLDFLVEDGDQIKLNSQVIDHFQDRISKLPTTNDLDNIFPEDDMEEDISSGDEPRQQIYFGTPGSGKSKKIERDILPKDEELVFRTTFHPDSDYSAFVGCYKPLMDGDKIKYEFSPQVFIDAYIAAWNNLEKEYYLVIEEINRGNCAQIFGDLFQLLDRDKNTGYSEYPIKADKDIRLYLDALSEKGLLNKDAINDGRLRLPRNLNIIATMNTSDQSLFPMDSAFKRRWDWEYVPIEYNNPDSAKFDIMIDGKSIHWHDFLRNVNEKIKQATASEDKQMGNFFIKKSVNEKEFCDKVMFYLWSEVGKDNYKTTDAIFKWRDEKDEDHDFTFSELYTSDEERKNLLKGFICFINDESRKNTETAVDANQENSENDAE